jgi:hypothetical protein
VRTYGPQAVNNDPYYQENMVLSDLPAGNYVVLIRFRGVLLNKSVTIHPGKVTYFTFSGVNLFHTDPPRVEGFKTPAP